MTHFENVPDVMVSAAGVRRVRGGHLWVYAADVTREPQGEGFPVVRVVEPSGKPLGSAFYSRLSQIRLRMLSRTDEPVTQDLFRARIERSIQRRHSLIRPESACRLVFGEADLLPSIVVDRYGDILVLQTLSAGADALKSLLAGMLRELTACTGILERNDVKTRRLEGLEEKSGVLWGTVPSQTEIVEDGLRFVVDLSAGQKTGFFLDQRSNRMACERYAWGRGLDGFTNTGAFALHLARRCSTVLGVDSSREALDLARRNAGLNGLANLEWQEGNVFDVLRELERSGSRFDTVALDPPAFAKNRGAIRPAKAGYKEINLRAMKILAPEGILVTSSCSYHLSEADFLGVLEDAARDARRRVQVLERRAQAEDHPVLTGMPETHYLKCFILRIL